MKTYVFALTSAAVLLGIFEWRTDEDLVTLGTLLAAGFALGALRPGLFWLSGPALGCVVPALNIFTSLTGLRPIYETASQAAAHDVRYGATLFVLAIPGLVAAAAGAGLRRITSPAFTPARN